MSIDISTIKPGQWVQAERNGHLFEGHVRSTESGNLFIGAALIRAGHHRAYANNVTSVTDTRPDNPRPVVTTAEELDALGEGSVVLSIEGDAWQKMGEGEWVMASTSTKLWWTGELTRSAPLTVLHDTTPPAPAMEPLPTEPSAIWATGSYTGQEYLALGPDHEGDWQRLDGDWLHPSQIANWRYYTGPEDRP